ncbi:MAG: DUF1080 domain-containing protein [Planctomycetaceae bacterium]
MPAQLRTTILTLAVTLALSNLTLAADPPTPITETPTAESPAKEDPKDNTAWRSLFDGKSLEGWAKTDFGGEGDVDVKDGLIIMKMGEPLTGITWKGKELPTVNYEVQCQAKRIQGSDFFCALTFPVQKSHCSIVLGGWGGSVIGLSSINGYDASENETTDYFTFEDDTWYNLRVRVTEKKIEVWLDKKQIANVDTTDKKISTRIEVDANRPLGFSNFQTESALRNIRLVELDANGKPKQQEKK